MAAQRSRRTGLGLAPTAPARAATQGVPAESNVQRQRHSVENPVARFRYIDTNPDFLAVDLARQRLPGTFEHALNHLLDPERDLSSFDARFRNDATGAPAYPAFLDSHNRARPHRAPAASHRTSTSACGVKNVPGTHI
jgi:hypothetical protein